VDALKCLPRYLTLCGLTAPCIANVSVSVTDANTRCRLKLDDTHLRFLSPVPPHGQLPDLLAQSAGRHLQRFELTGVELSVMQVTLITEALARNAERLASLELPACGLSAAAALALLHTWGKERPISASAVGLDLSYNPLEEEANATGTAPTQLGDAVENAARYLTRLDLSYTGLAEHAAAVVAIREAWHATHFAGHCDTGEGRLCLSAQPTASPNLHPAPLVEKTDENVDRNRQHPGLDTGARCGVAGVAASQVQTAAATASGVDHDEIAYLLAGLEDEADSAPFD
jgi:hypothetical protein